MKLIRPISRASLQIEGPLIELNLNTRFRSPRSVTIIQLIFKVAGNCCCLDKELPNPGILEVYLDRMNLGLSAFSRDLSLIVQHRYLYWKVAPRNVYAEKGCQTREFGNWHRFSDEQQQQPSLKEPDLALTETTGRGSRETERSYFRKDMQKKGN